MPTVPFDSVSGASTAETLSEEKTGAMQLYADLVERFDKLVNVGVGTPSIDGSLPSDPQQAKALRARLIKDYRIQSLMSCSTCHR